jgi:glycosyltransferase involved in cell wall biosynthesis
MLLDALDSLLARRTGGHFDYEILVLDDGSSDATPAVVEEVCRRTSVTVHYLFQEGGGTACARNTGFRAASAQWIAFLDDDERAAPDWLAQLLSCARSQSCPCVGGGNELLLSDKQKASLGPVSRSLLGETTELTNVPYRLSSRMLPGSGNVLISRAAADAGGFDVTLLSGELRYDLFARMRDAGFELWFSHPLASIMSSLLRELFPVANRSSLA